MFYNKGQVFTAYVQNVIPSLKYVDYYFLFHSCLQVFLGDLNLVLNVFWDSATKLLTCLKGNNR